MAVNFVEVGIISHNVTTCQIQFTHIRYFQAAANPTHFADIRLG
jgi:hypothetical protein